MPNDPQVPWTDEQWARVNQVIQEEASRARVAASFLPLSGPLPPDTDFVRAEIIPEVIPAGKLLNIEDRDTIRLATLQVKVEVRSAQMADPELTSVLALFRRAANVIARLEDAVVFRGLDPAGSPPPEAVAGLPPIWQIDGGGETPGLWAPEPPRAWPWKKSPFTEPAPWQWIPIEISDKATGDNLVRAVSNAIGQLEGHGHFGPFAAVLSQGLFLIAQTPNQGSSLVLPQDRIIPFLGGGSLLRSSTIGQTGGVVVALGGAPVELVIATDVSLQFLQITAHPKFLFRVREKIALRIKEAGAIVRLHVVPPPPTVTAINPPNGSAAGGTPIVITGTNFTGVTEVRFGPTVVMKGTNKANGFKFDSDTQITVPLPRGTAGEKVYVKVTTPSGTGPDADDPQKNEFSYD
jgi:uncharacterized linocin/CFP29 family protein